MNSLSAIAPLTTHALVIEVDGRRDLKLFALLGEECVAALGVAHFGECAVTLYQVFVTAEWRGDGVGRALVERALEMARAEGAKGASAVVAHDGSIGFWSALRFTPVHAEGASTLVARILEE